MNQEIYGNNVVLAPDGEILFRCGDRKANWYLKRDLAIVLKNKNPRTIRLTFEPAGRGVRNDPYCLAEKDNVCVVCGTQEDLTKHHVVPSCYRKYLPDKYKSKAMHDVLLLCEECHRDYEVKALERKEEIAEIYDAPVDGLYEPLSAIYRICHTLLNVDSLPPERRQHLMRKVESHFGRRVSREEMEDLAGRKRQAKKTHGEIVIDMLSEEEYDSFIIDWRKHFVQTMKPEFLSDMWEVERTYKDRDWRR